MKEEGRVAERKVVSAYSCLKIVGLVGGCHSAGNHSAEEQRSGIHLCTLLSQKELCGRWLPDCNSSADVSQNSTQGPAKYLSLLRVLLVQARKLSG